MPQPLDDPILTAFAAGTLLLSAAVGVFLLIKQQWGPLLPYEPRRPVPWNSAAALLAALFVLMALLAPRDDQNLPQQQQATPALQENSSEPQENANAPHDALNLLSALLPELLLVGGTLFLIAVYFKATPRDLGLPPDGGVLAHDVLIGLVAGLAALAPVHMLQLWLAHLMEMDERSGHPVVKMLIEGKPDIATLLFASFAVVVVAPICEEIAFRLLLQGWLERWEAMLCGWRDKPSPVADEGANDPFPIADSMTNDEARMTKEASAAEAVQSSVVNHQSSIDTLPIRGYAGWPFGWLPIAMSSLLFGLAHFGYGPEPIPLFFLGLILGYVYQRTHRIVPCIVAHALFNLFTVVVLWWMVFHGEK